MILIIGATGVVGGEIAHQLTAAGHQARALVRNPNKAEGLKQIGVEVVAGDAEDAASVEAALKDVGKVLVSTSAEERLVEVQKKLFDTIRSTGAPHTVKISAMGAATNAPFRFGKVHGAADRALANSGIPNTILRPAYFMQNFFGAAPTIASHNTFYLPIGDGKVALVDVRDIAAVAVKVLTDGDHEGITYDITGPEALSGSEMAQTLSRALGKQINFVSADPEQFKKQVLSVGVSQWLADGLIEMYTFFAKGNAAKTTNAIQTIAGRAPNNFQEFANDHAQVFLQHAVSA